MAGLIVLWLLCGVVCAVIASNKGKSAVGWFFLGCILGVFGIIIIAVLPSEQPTAVRVVNDWSAGSEPSWARTREASPPPVPQSALAKVQSRYDAAKWQVLKEVDPDIAASAARVAALGPNFEAELAEKYLTLNDKSYLASVEKVILDREEDKARRAREASAAQSAEEIEASEKELSEYLVALKANENVDPRYNEQVQGAEVYVGSWRPANGGIRITLRNGDVLLKKGYFYRRFRAGEELP